MTDVAFLGMGAMGSRMASNLLAAGQRVTVWNRDPERVDALARQGAKVARSPREAATGATVCFSMLRDDAASQEVWLDPASGAIHGLSAGSIAVECSTVTPHWVVRLWGELAARGIESLDAPVVGSRAQAESAQLIFLVGGSVETAEAIRSLFSVMGSATYHVGSIGSGSTLKLAVNALLGIQVTALAEIIAVLKARGVDTAKVGEILPNLPVMSAAAKGALGSMLRKDFSPLFTVALAAKDLDYLASITAGLVRPTLVADAARATLHEALRKSLGDENLTAIVQLFE